MDEATFDEADDEADDEEDDEEDDDDEDVVDESVEVSLFSPQAARDTIIMTARIIANNRFIICLLS